MLVIKKFVMSEHAKTIRFFVVNSESQSTLIVHVGGGGGEHDSAIS